MASINFRFKLLEISNLQEILKEMETESVLETLFYHDLDSFSSTLPGLRIRSENWCSAKAGWVHEHGKAKGSPTLLQVKSSAEGQEEFQFT